MSSINFDNPWLLLIVLPIVVCIAVPFFITVGKDNRNVHNVTSTVLHLLMAVCIGFSAAGTSIKSVLTETNVYVVADLSYSTHNNLDAIDEHIKYLRKNLPLNTQMGVVCFGATDSQVVHTPLGEKPKSVRAALEEVDTTADPTARRVDDSATDIISALNFTSKIFKAGVVKRIVLITDAKQSNESDKYALKRTVDALHAAQIYVDAIYLDSNLPEGAKEVQISGADIVERVYKNAAATAKVYVQSTIATRAKLKMTCNGKTVYDKPINLTASMQQFSLSLQTDVAGKYDYIVTVEETDGDENVDNNVWSFTQIVAGDPMILFITDPDAEIEKNGYTDDAGILQEMYGEEYGKAIVVKNVDDPDIPYTVSELSKYDEIVLSNVNVTDIRNPAMFMDSLETVVSVLGKSLIGIGDLHLESLYEEDTTGKTEILKRLANMMPVRYGSPISDSKLYAIVLDVSNSMEQAGKFALAKQAAKSILDLLNDNDLVEVYGFWGSSKSICDGKASGREELKAAIDKYEGDHNTVISGGINELLSKLEDSTIRQTQMYLITDGRNAASDWVTAQEKVNKLANKYGVITSVLGIQAETNRSYLEMLASEKTDGSGEKEYWAINAKSDLNLVLPQMGSIDGGTLPNPTDIATNHPYNAVLENIEVSGGSYIGGYVTSRAKPNADTILTAAHKRLNDEALQIPLYSSWEHGNGKVAAFLSPISGDWMRNWNNKGIDKQFLSNMLAVNIPAQRVDVPFVTDIMREGGGATMEIRLAEQRGTTSLGVTLIAPDGEREPIRNLLYNSGIYTCSFALPDLGAYTVEITYSDGVNTHVSNETVTVAYLAEYDRFEVYDSAPLYTMLGANGTVSEDGKLKLENDENEVGVRIVDLKMPLLIVCVVLFVADIVVRKLKWADIRGLFRKKRKEGRQ